MSLPYTAKMVGDFNYSGIKIQADIASGNNTFTMAFRNDENQSLYPVSVLEEDIRKTTKAASPIVVVLRKDKRAKEYDEITYVSKNINISNLHFPKEIKDKLSDRAYGMLKPELSAEKTETKQKDLPQKNPQKSSFASRIQDYKARSKQLDQKRKEAIKENVSDQTLGSRNTRKNSSQKEESL